MALSILRKCAHITSALAGRHALKKTPSTTLITQTATAERESDGVYSFSFASFDSTLGTLEKVTLALSASVEAAFSFTNASAKNAHVSLSNEIEASLGDDHAALCMKGNASLSLKAKVDAGQEYQSGKVIRPFEFQPAAYTAPVVLSTFSADGGGAMALCLIAKASKSFRSFGGSGIYSLKTDLMATLTVTYFYRKLAGAIRAAVRAEGLRGAVVS